MMLAKHETCQQYVARRLSEGWRIAGSWRHLVFLFPPDGNFIRVVDLRNDIETLRPNEAGDETSIPHAIPGTVEEHWEDVDEAVADENSTYVYTTSTTYTRDLYGMEPSGVGAGTINSITIYFRIAIGNSSYAVYAKPSQKSGVTVTDGTEVSKTGVTTYETFNQVYATNPATAVAYTWGEIDALQIGLQLRTSYRVTDARCTQVYVEVDYTSETAYNTMVGNPTSWLWEKCDYGAAEQCPVGSEASWIWKAPTLGGPDKTPQGAPTSFAWGSE